MDMEAFFRLHDGLPREGPGCEADVLWAALQAGVSDTARILDAGSGPGGDVAALLQVAAQGRVLAVDSHTGFIEDLNRRFAGDDRVARQVGDMLAPDGPFDLIWCAGAIYFHGVTVALQGWRAALAPGGAVVFSQGCLFQPGPPDEVTALFGDVPLGDADHIAGEIEAAGYDLIASRKVSDAAWEAYYQPQEARIATLRPGADPALAQILDEAENEIAVWRTNRARFGYLLCVVKPR